MKQPYKVDLDSVRAVVAQEQAVLLKKGIPIFYISGARLIEERADGSRRPSKGAPALDCDPRARLRARKKVDLA